MGWHRKTIRRKRPLTQTDIKSTNRRDVIKSLHNDLKANRPRDNAQLARYQQASSKGQDPQHGGDSSRVLVPWLRASPTERMKVLEVGCLDCDNAIAKFVKCQKGSIRRIDLKSRDPRIEEQDFMTLSLADEAVPSSLQILEVTMLEIRLDFVISGVEFRSYAAGTI